MARWSDALRLGLLTAWLGAVAALAAPVPGDGDGGAGQQCRSAPLCRDGGALLHQPNSRGTPIWTTRCRPVAVAPRMDEVCRQIASCPGSGGFGSFLLAVTEGCRAKHFSDYFGLDGMTFGILHWTSDNLPALLAEYRARSPEHYQRTLGGAGIRTLANGCVDPKWVCEGNRSGGLMCEGGFHAGFEAAVDSKEFQQAQAAVALRTYEARLKNFEGLGLRTAYGNVAMAVVANNLRPGSECRPETWKRACTGRAGERALVDCMLDEYVAHGCRGGSPNASAERRRAILTQLSGLADDAAPHPKIEAVLQCGWIKDGG